MKLKKLDMRGFSHDIFLVAFVLVFVIVGVAYLVASHADTCVPSTSPTACQPASGPVSRSKLAAGEQLSIPPQRRPVQYVHLCKVGTTSGVPLPGPINTGASNTSTLYVTQGTPNCLAGSTFQYNYAPSVPGTVYSVPCETTSGALLRYVYISTTENCPVGTTPQMLGAGEQLSIPPQRRPVQYVHVCTAMAAISTSVTVPGGTKSSTVTYVAQGATNCLPGGNFQYNYDPSVPGTTYNLACHTTTGNSIRYGYIAKGESCPTGTVAVNPAG
jgi:hypothetical protein